MHDGGCSRDHDRREGAAPALTERIRPPLRRVLPDTLNLAGIPVLPGNIMRRLLLLAAILLLAGAAVLVPSFVNREPDRPVPPLVRPFDPLNLGGR